MRLTRAVALLFMLVLTASAKAQGLGGPGNVGGYDINVSVNPTVSTSAYTANYAVGGLQTVPLIRSVSPASGLLTYIGVNSKGGMTTGIAIYGFRKAPASTCTDSAAFVLSSSDLPYLIPGFPVTITPATTVGTTQSTNYYAFVPPTSVINADTPVSKNLYFCAVTTGTPTLASTSDLIFNYGMVQD